MKRLLIIVITLIVVALPFFINAQPLQITWQHCYGGPRGDRAASSVQISENNYIILGGNSASGGDVSNNNGKGDFWLVKTDVSGNLIWEKSFGGSEVESAEKILVTPDGDYVLFGQTFSNDGDVSGNHGGQDFWLVKTDSTGNMLWQRCIGSSVNDFAYDMEMDSVGNMYLLGYTHGTDGDVSSNNGHGDYWFLKVSPEGNILWDKNLGGSFSDWGKCLALTNDGGLIVGGLTESNDQDVSCNEELWQQQAWIVKLDSLNNIEWQTCLGGSYSEDCEDICQTDDNGYILLCRTNSNDGDVTGFHGSPGSYYNDDLWVVKLDSIGNMEWQRCLGGTDMERPRFIKITEEGNYFVGGTTESNDGDVSGNHSVKDKFDFWLVELSSAGELIWQQCFGGEWYDSFYDLLMLSNDRYLLLGGTATFNNTGDVNCNYKGNGDMWLFEVKDTTVGLPENMPAAADISVSPNPAKTYVSFKYSLPANASQSSIEIRNLAGQPVHKITLYDRKGETVWVTGNTTPGVYIFILKTTDGFKTGKIVITR